MILSQTDLRGEAVEVPDDPFVAGTPNFGRPQSERVRPHKEERPLQPYD